MGYSDFMYYQDLISVIIPTRNRARFLKKAVESVINQSYSNWELILVDDNSDDETGQICERLTSRNNKVLYIRNSTTMGGAKARNIGIKNAKGKYIAFLDDDDIWMPSKLEKQSDIFIKKNGLAACTCSYIFHKPFSFKKTIVPPEIITNEMLLGRNMAGGSSMILCESSVLKGLGGFDETLPSGQDWDLWIKLSQKGKIFSIKEPLVIYNNHFGERITLNYSKAIKGYRKVFFKFRREMSSDNRKTNIRNLCVLKSINTEELCRGFRYYLMGKNVKSSSLPLLKYIRIRFRNLFFKQ